jgi:aldose sugar dehydrogenase
MKIRLLGTSALAAGLLALTTPIGALSQPPAAQNVRLPGPDEPLVLSAGAGQQIRVVLVANELAGPWDMAFLPRGDILVTESPGRLRVIRDGKLVAEPVWESPSPPGNDVLHGVVIHPDFEQNGYVYTSYAKGGEENLRTVAVSRGRLEGDGLVDVEEIFVADAWENAANAIAGRMIFARDGTLLLTIGDRDRLCCGPVDDNSIRIKAQHLDNHVGKILRLTDDGGVPGDNPFVGDPDAKPEIYSYGHRNAYGFTYHPETDELWVVDIGPMGGDKVDILKPGANYGWPLVNMGRNYTGTLVSDQPFHRPGMELPRIFWVPAISPASIAFYSGERFPQWQNNLFVAALSGQQLQRVAFGGAGGQSERRIPMLTELGVRFRDVQQGPDGYIYVATEIRYGSGNPDGTILRIEPVE